MSSFRTASLAVLLGMQAASLWAAGPSVSRQDAEELFARLGDLYAGERADEIVELIVDPVLAGRTKARLVGLFRSRNYFRFDAQIRQFLVQPDGRASLLAATSLRSRRKDETEDTRTKKVHAYELAWVDGQVRILSTTAAPQPKLPERARWVVEDFTGDVSFWPEPAAPFRSSAGRADVALRMRIRNTSPLTLATLEFGLHPFVSELAVRGRKGQVLDALRFDGVLDLWRVELLEGVATQGVLEVELTYSFDEVGISEHSSLGASGLHLFSSSAWHPLFGEERFHIARRATHDLSVEVPAAMTAVAPGVLASVESVGADRRSFRWFSRHPGAELSIVAGLLDHQVIPLTRELNLDLYRRGRHDAPLPDPLISRLKSIAAFGTESFGPPPTDRLTVVEMSGGSAKAAPGFLAIGNLLEEHDSILRPMSELLFFFQAHSLAHLWFVDAVVPGDPAAQVLGESLCDHFASLWSAQSVHPSMPTRFRSEVLAGARNRADADRPLLEAEPRKEFDALFGRGKGMVVLDMYHAFAGEEAWSAALTDYQSSHRSGLTGIGALLKALGGEDPRLQGFVTSWFSSRGFADPKLGRHESIEIAPGPDGAKRYRVEVEVLNGGQGPIPVLVVANAGELVFRETVDVAADSTTLVSFESAHPLLSVRLDPLGLVWQGNPTNDNWPKEVKRHRDYMGSGPALDDKARARMMELMAEAGAPRP